MLCASSSPRVQCSARTTTPKRCFARWPTSACSSPSTTSARDIRRSATSENLPFSILKIDKSFLDNPQPAASPLLRGIIALAKTMELTVVAEGIERQDQLAAVHQLRCEIGQGFFLARTAPAAKITELLAEERLPRRFTQLHIVE